MASSTNGRRIQLRDFKIKSPLPMPKLLRYPSRLALKFSVNGIGKKVVNTHRDIKEGRWEANGNVEIRKDQLLTATILIYVKGSTKELSTLTISYSQLLSRAQARSKVRYEFPANDSTSSALVLVTCSIRVLAPLPRKQHISTESVFSPKRSKSDKGHIGSNRTLTLDVSHPSIADLERDCDQTAILPAERKSQALNTIGWAYQIMYTTTGKMEHLERSISLLKKAVKIAPTGHPDQPVYLNTLGIALERRFGQLGRVKDLKRAIVHIQKAVDLTPDGHSDQPDRLNNLGDAFEARFNRLGHVKDLEMAIAQRQKAVDLTPDSHPNKPSYLNNLGISFESRFDRLGRVEDLEMAIAHQQKALDLTPDDHPDKPGYLDSLGTAVEIRFDRLDRVEDLEMAITYKQKALDLTPDDDPNKPLYSHSLGSAFNTRFDRLGRVKDLGMAIAHMQKAVEMTPDGHPEQPGHLNSLGSALETRFHQSGRVKDLKRAIVHMQKALDLTPDDDPNKPLYSNSLGIAFNTKFDRLGRIEDLEIAIAHAQKAVALTPDNHPDKPIYLNTLANAFESRFARLGHLEDLEMTIADEQKAVDLTPDDHPVKPGRLNNLGNAFAMRFERLGHVKDLEMAIVDRQKAVDLTPDGHPDKPGYYNNLGIVLQERFIQLHRIKDLESAILHTQKAVDLTPDGHPEQPRRLICLGNALEEQFNQSGHVEDLEMAVAQKQKAVDLTANGHPNKPVFLNSLGNAFMNRLERLGCVEDLRAAVIQFSTAASLPTGSPRVRLDAAMYWASALEVLEASGVSISSPLEPYHIAIDILPRVAWLGVPIPTQHTLLEEVGGTVCEAVFEAIKFGEYKTAVEWAEAGRSIAWQNLLNLRTPVSELRSAHYDLAERLEAISRQLDMSVRRSDSRLNGAINEMEKVSRSHVQIALDWDNIVAKIRSKPGFESFLKPKSFHQLKRIARDGPVVILNVIEVRCDALVLIPEDNDDVSIFNISLGDFSYDEGEALLEDLKQLLRSRNLRERNARSMKRKRRGNNGRSNLADILRCLWTDIVKPIVEALAYQPRSINLPHIWWCTTGPLAFLPIHAAGLYDTDEPGSKLSDYAVSSYTPTLSTLLNDSTPSLQDFKLLAIAQANAPGASPIPKTEIEVEQIQTLAKNINVTTLVKEDATVENVWRGMEESNWVHLACHGQQNINEPMKSGLLLHDGTLELRRLVEKPLPLADFAFLSACQTATGDESVAEESVHLAAGMLFAGYKGVIATMWSIKDEVGPRVAEDVYRVMLKDGKPNRKVAAHALHEAVRRLREDPKVDMLHWVPFIHIGR